MMSLDTPPGVDDQELKMSINCSNCDHDNDVIVYLWRGYGEWTCETCGHVNEYQE